MTALTTFYLKIKNNIFLIFVVKGSLKVYWLYLPKDSAMRIGVTNLFKGSAFGGSLPQVALNIATALKDAGHDVSFLLPAESEDWFIDCSGAKTIPCVRLAEGARVETFNMVIEVVWFLPFAVRQQIAQKVVMFYHYPPAFYDIESSTYPLSTMIRDFNGVSALWTWSHFKATDYAYLEFLSRKPVFKCPFFWNPHLLSAYVKEAAVPDYVSDLERKIVICESNQTNTSNCTLPMVILSEIYKNDSKQKWSVLNSEELCKREFFVNNILKNLHIGSGVDISGNFMKRIRLPDLCRESNIIIGHQRFRPLKYMLLDALWLGIPLIHNCELLKDMAGGQYYYELNRIGQALVCWRRITTEVRPDLVLVRAGLLAKWGPAVGSEAMNGLIESVFSWVPPVVPVRASVRIAFFDMWVDFQPAHNLFLEAFAQNGFNVVNDQADPTLIVFGPFGNENVNVKWSSIPKVFYTGENLPPVIRKDVVLNVGFSLASMSQGIEYLRLPNWFLELNWYNQDAGLIKNPVPFSLDLLSAPVTMREKFCIFVASNQNSVNRNTLYNVVSRYKHIDSAGVLFNNCFQIPGGPGGSGGQVAKVEAYKSYKFALVCENSQSAGYVTEKLVHAKLAGCVPIYWGDPQVALDFNNDAFINVADYFSVDALLSKIKQLDTDAGAWLNMATAPLLNGVGVDKCKGLLGLFAKKLMDIKPTITGEVQSNISGLTTAASASAVDRPKISSYGMTPIVDVAPQVIVTCCNGKYVDSAVRLIKSSKVPVYVWVWDIEFMDVKKLTKAGAKLVTPLDTKWNPQWADFWNPAHYAWKPLVMVLANSTLPKGTQVLYLDSGIEIVDDLTAVWTNIGRDGFFICKMPEHKMATWCHPKFCSLLAVTPLELIEAQVSANIVGFVSGGEVATNILGQTLGSACNPEIIVGQKWHQYSNVCIGHRHDQSILSLVCIRAGIKMHILDMFAGWKSYDETLKYGQLLYVHRGNWRQVTPEDEVSGAPEPSLKSELKGFSDCLVVNLAHRQDRLEQFWCNQPYLKGRAKRLDAVNGRELVLTRDMCNLFKNNDFKWKKSVMGCALSHYAIWKQMSGMGSAGHTLVLEDDALLVDGFVEKWNAINGLLPQDADIIFLGGVLPPNKPGLPMVTEPVNLAFAKVAVNTMFGSKRRYFHFCTYAYVLTNTGAQKLCALIDKMGIYTSADHMLVNNMDLLNVYFTTPLLAGCVQDNDPIYQNADFNNFNRVDKFDSEIWNNTDCFSNEEVLAVIGGVSFEKISVVFFEHEQYKQCIDAQWLGEIFQREFVWTEHTATVKSGSKVIVYYQHTTPVALIEGWINRNADCQIYLLHASDESCKADVSLYRHPAVRCVFRNYWRPECVAPNVVHLPLGYLNGKRGTGKVLVASQRPVDWSFAGAMDRNNRKAVIEDLQKRYPKNKLHLTMTWGSSDNLEVDKYVALLDESKFVPCLDGFFNTESYRFYEALEHGALPIICLDDKKSYENILCGLPLLSVGSWSDEIAFDWDVKQKELLYAWVNYKVGLTKLINEKLA